MVMRMPAARSMDEELLPVCAGSKEQPGEGRVHDM